MDMLLYAFDEENNFVYKGFVITSSGNPFFNSRYLCDSVLGYIVRFMENGRAYVHEKEWSDRRGWYLFDDKKPDDFD